MTPQALSSVKFCGDMKTPVFLPTGTNGVITTGFACYPVLVFHGEMKVSAQDNRQPKGASIKDVMARFESNPSRAAAMARARARLGNWMEQELPDTHGLPALRLKAGLSQATLAERLGTQQSNISRWEKNPSDMQYSTIKRMAAALNVSIQSICDAIDKSGTNAEKASA